MPLPTNKSAYNSHKDRLYPIRRNYNILMDSASCLLVNTAVKALTETGPGSKDDFIFYVNIASALLNYTNKIYQLGIKDTQKDQDAFVEKLRNNWPAMDEWIGEATNEAADMIQLALWEYNDLIENWNDYLPYTNGKWVEDEFVPYNGNEISPPQSTQSITS